MENLQREREKVVHRGDLGEGGGSDSVTGPWRPAGDSHTSRRSRGPSRVHANNTTDTGEATAPGVKQLGIWV